jgi:glycerol kinase
MFLAIDQGTTSTKAGRLGPDGRLIVFGNCTHQQIRLHAGWVEHDPLELLGNIRALLEQAGKIASVGLANQGETVVAWDARSKRPIANAIVWQDVRTEAEISALRAQGAEALTLAQAGLPLDAYFSASKLRWLLDNVPEAASLRREGRLRLGTSDAYFIDALTGEFATDVSTASRTSLMNLKTLQWDDELCALFGVPMECLPEIRPTVGSFGVLPNGAVIKASAVDQQGALFGHGCKGTGDIKITFGTGGFALGLTGNAPVLAGNSGLLPTVAWQIDGHTQYALDGGILTAGSALEWLRDIRMIEDFSALDEFGPGSAAEAGLFFIPAQAGLGCPYWDRAARGGWIGLGTDTSRAAMVKAVPEGIALRAAQIVRAFGKSSGIGRVSIDGGLSRSDYFTQFLSDVLGVELFVAGQAEMTLTGLLRLCGGVVSDADWRVIEPRTTDFTAIQARFAEAVERMRGWAP